jgi:hypothetical protein
VYLKRTNVIIEAGAQQIARGIQSGPVKIIRASTQNPNATSMKNRLDCKKISSITIIDRRVNFSSILATLLSLCNLIIKTKVPLFDVGINNL